MAKKPQTHEGEDFNLGPSTAAFCAQFSTDQTTSKRLQAERRANRASRPKRAVRTERINFRTTSEDRDLAARLAKHLGISIGKMYDMAAQELAKREGLKVKK